MSLIDSRRPCTFTLPSWAVTKRWTRASRCSMSKNEPVNVKLNGIGVTPAVAPPAGVLAAGVDVLGVVLALLGNVEVVALAPPEVIDWKSIREPRLTLSS